MTKSANRTTLLFLAFLATGVVVSSAKVRSFAQSRTVTTQSSSSAQHNERSLRTDDNEWHWRHSDNGIGLEVRIRGQVEFADDYSDITSISDGGSLRVTDERGGVTRKFEAKTTSGGIQRSYWVDGASREFDGEAKAWLAKILDDTVRQGGYDARPRVQRILKQSGPTGVLQEITRLTGDYVKRVYFDELINSASLNDETVRQVLRQAASEIRSDYEKAQLLIKLSERYLANEAQRTIYLEGVNTLRSDYEKGRALGALLKKGNLSNESILFALRAVRGVSSDYERAQLLIKIADRSALDESSRAAYLESVATLRSSYEKARVLSAFLKNDKLEKADLLFVLKAASTISSDYDRAQLLIKIAAGSTLDEPARVAYLDAVGTMRSDHDKGQALAAFLKVAPQKDSLLLAVKGATNLSSDYEKAQFLIKVAAVGADDESVRSALITAARTIRSEHDRGRVLNAVFR
ncbi:MAG TPA: hypothetical protein VFF31_27370 [Blastocatellia bacterium]|nr:hypothetical protein [Blastocatellia bacterium]